MLLGQREDKLEPRVAAHLLPELISLFSRACRPTLACVECTNAPSEIPLAAALVNVDPGP